MFRSFLLFLLTKPEIGITAWVNELYRVPLYAILSGFVPGDVPGVGTCVFRSTHPPVLGLPAR